MSNVHEPAPKLLSSIGWFDLQEARCLRLRIEVRLVGDGRLGSRVQIQHHAAGERMPKLTQRLGIDASSPSVVW
jgi:hypothetical protein